MVKNKVLSVAITTVVLLILLSACADNDNQLGNGEGNPSVYDSITEAMEEELNKLIILEPIRNSGEMLLVDESHPDWVGTDYYIFIGYDTYSNVIRVTINVEETKGKDILTEFLRIEGHWEKYNEVSLTFNAHTIEVVKDDVEWDNNAMPGEM